MINSAIGRVSSRDGARSHALKGRLHKRRGPTRQMSAGQAPALLMRMEVLARVWLLPVWQFSGWCGAGATDESGECAAGVASPRESGSWGTSGGGVEKGNGSTAPTERESECLMGNVSGRERAIRAKEEEEEVAGEDGSGAVSEMLGSTAGSTTIN